MTQWFVKDLSKLTDISVQTLHHYDRIGLLKPSVRMMNGYRVYSETDLLKLQQILALKFFGFELAQIKKLLVDSTGALNHFGSQVKFLEQKAQSLFDASIALNKLISDVKDDKSIPWKTIIQTIEVYKMTQKIHNSWVKEIFTPEELDQFAAFDAELNRPENLNKKPDFQKKWNALMQEINLQLNKDPRSEVGVKYGKKAMESINAYFGKKYLHLRTKIWEQGFGEGKGLDDVGLSPEIHAWLDAAIDAYWHDRLYSILAQVGKTPDAKIHELWNKAMDDMYGNEGARKNVLIDIALKDDKVSDAAKKWLRDLMN